MKSYKQFLKESDEVLISYKDYPLKEKYKTFNRLYFEGKLPDIPVEWGKTPKNASGLTTGKAEFAPGEKKPMGRMLSFVRMTGKINHLKIVMSPQVPSRTEEKWDVLLIHEMIHVELMNQGWWYESHGMRFQRRVIELSRLSKMRIPITDLITSDQMNQVDETKPYVMLVVGDPTGPYTYGMLTPNWMKKIDELKDLLSKRYIGGSRKEDISAYYVAASKIAVHHQLNRSFPPDMYRAIKYKEQLDADIKSGKHLFTINPRKEADAFFNS